MQASGAKRAARTLLFDIAVRASGGIGYSGEVQWDDSNLEIPRCAIAHLSFDASHRPGVTMPGKTRKI